MPLALWCSLTASCVNELAVYQISCGAFDALQVSGSSQPTVVAGALSARCRDNAPVCLIGIGVDAVTNAVSGIQRYPASLRGMVTGNIRACLGHNLGHSFETMIGQ
jgi:stage V sporulation protein SpoVS